MSWERDEKNRLGKPEQICWTCEKATGECSWSSDFIPVEGWTAEPDTILRQETEDAKTYKIFDCPEYERSYNGKRRP